MRISKSDVLSIEKTVEALKKGDVVIIPTDTVYGFSGIVCKDFDTDVKIKNITLKIKKFHFFSIRIKKHRKINDFI